MTRQAAAIHGTGRTGKSEMQRVPDEIVDEDSDLGHAKSLLSIDEYLFRFQMMSKEATGHDIKALVAEGQGKSVAHDAAFVVIQVVAHSV